MDDGLPDGEERVLVDVGHIVVEGVPGGTEAALLAVGVVGDDVDAGDVGHGVHGDMVVGDATAFGHGEEAAVAHHSCGLPYLVDDVLGIIIRHALLIKLCALSAHHVEQDAVTGLVARRVEVSCPVFGTEGPGVAGIIDGLPLGEAVVFGIEADEVEAEV